MVAKKCSKCHSELGNVSEACQYCGEKPSRLKKMMTWFVIILLLVMGMLWAFTDSEPDVTIDPTPNTQEQ